MVHMRFMLSDVFPEHF